MTLSPSKHAADLTRAGIREDRSSRPAGDGCRDIPAAHSGRAGCEQHDLVAEVFARVRGVSGISALNHGRHVPIIFRYRAPLGAVGVGGLTVSSPASLRRLKFSGPLARWSFPLRVQPRKQARYGLSKCFRSFSTVLFHASKETHGAFEWNEKVFPNPPKVLVKST